MRLKKIGPLLLAAALAIQLLAVPALAVSNEEYIWVYLRGKGLSQPAVAGIMGNIQAESGYYPNNLENAANKRLGITDAEFTAMVDNGTISRAEFASSTTYGIYPTTFYGTQYYMYGYGLAQWTWFTLKEALYDFAKARGTSVGDMDTQLDYLVESALAMKKLAGYGQSTDVAEATRLFHKVYENSSSTETMIAKRVAVAQAVFDKYGDATVLFPKADTYQSGRFSDVAAGKWYAAPVAKAYELGLMEGTSATKFSPHGNVTLAETITMAARIHSIYYTGAESFKPSGAWYQVYLDYALKNGIIDQATYKSDMNKAATRAQVAAIFANALPADGFIAINTVSAIPDVKTTDGCGPAVYKLYKAGVLAGSDAKGTFHPTYTITRAEAAAIAGRMGDSSARVSVTLP